MRVANEFTRAALTGVEAIYGAAKAAPPAVTNDPWSVADSFELMGARRVPFEALIDGKPQRFVAVTRGPSVEIAFREPREIPSDGLAPTVLAVEDGVLVLHGGRQTHVSLANPLEGEEAGLGESDGAVKAPMHGRLIALAVADGETVEAGQRLAAVEAMKMEHALTAPRAGKVKLVGPKVGDTVEQGAVILSVEE